MKLKESEITNKTILLRLKIDRIFKDDDQRAMAYSMIFSYFAQEREQKSAEDIFKEIELFIKRESSSQEVA